MKVYKLTDAEGRTHGDTLWGEGITHEASGDGGLCGPGWLHFYTDPLLAVLLNPIHADFPSGYRLWEAEAEGKILMDLGLKGGCARLTTLREIVPPTITTEQRVRFAILCAKQVRHEADWTAWADRWLSREDRSKAAAARAAARAAEAAADEAETWAAAAATWAAARADRWLSGKDRSETWAEAARAAAWTAEAGEINLIALAKEAVMLDGALNTQAC